MKNDFIYDVESFLNIFMLNIKSVFTGDKWVFEISERRNDLTDIIAFLYRLRDIGARMVGFNNIGYDYPMIHFMMTNAVHGVSYVDIRNKSDQIIATPWEQRFNTRVAPWDIIIPQLDLFLIHHFDNHARITSLKQLEFAMRSKTIEEFSAGFDHPLTLEQMDEGTVYNDYDVDQTEVFYNHSLELIEFRDELTAQHGHDFTNYNDTKIGKQYFEMELEKHSPGICRERINGKKVARQTLRPQIALNDIIFQNVSFQRPEFNRILNYFREQVITETKGVFDDLSCEIYGLTYHFGVGGIHASVESQTVIPDPDCILRDIDVRSYYPKLAIANRIYPAHLGEIFCDIYEDLYDQRTKHPKGSAPNKMLKLALNGVYGDSGNKYSPFFDTQYMMSITINGQLLMCMLAEMLLQVRDLDIIQVNTDGLTIHCPRDELSQVDAICHWWQSMSHLTLEEVEYRRMFIRDVNNYIAEDTKGNVKRKGAYEYKTEWHQDHGRKVVAMAAEAELLYGVPVEDFITAHTDHYDFMMCTKLQRTSHLMHGETLVQNTTRYYMSTDGDYLYKMMPPLKGKTDYRQMRIKAGFKTTVCNDVKNFNPATINYEWYIEEARKLVRVMG